ncbi:MAG: bifunctional transaldolase/phosoglucose isomerase [Candidatus Omnitrophica bacterium]|nr:bifunctional transaldolase/phosoglucose isomerase [Candidatus Omnitrophota bacterium]
MRAALEILPTQKLYQAGQSPWLDYLSRDMILSGKLKSLIDESGILGVTSNPSIFQNAISQSKGAYDKDIQRLTRAKASTLEIYDALTVSDIQKACDLFLKIHTRTKGEHGFVSLEVLPNLAYCTEKTVLEALRLFKKVDRPNIMIKVPATPEGIPAIRRLIAAGININITLIFSVRQYRDVALAYQEGLQDRLKSGSPIAGIRSVASVFVSRFDTLIDKELESLVAKGKKEASRLMGKAAVANSKLVYQEFKKLFETPKFKKLQTRGGQIQKVLWGSTSSKNPKYPDLLYVEPLVGRETVNTMPQITVDALLDHGNIRENTLEQNVQDAKQITEQLQALGISLEKTGEQLQIQGVKLFCDAFDDLMRSLEKAQIKKAVALPTRKGPLARYDFHLSEATKGKITDRIEGLVAQELIPRFLKQDPTLWKAEEFHVKSINNRLGWLKAHDWILGKLYELDQLAEEIRTEGIQDIVLLGMGGSSLAPEVMNLICKRPSKAPRFCIVDTTDPGSIGNVLKRIQIKKTLFVVSSKSGSTIETFSQYKFFYQQCEKVYGKKLSADAIGRHWIAITDAGSTLEVLANKMHFRQCFINPSNIGGRFSVLSLFGIVPAALLGINVRGLLEDAQSVFTELEGSTFPSSAHLGIVLAHLSLEGRDKMTLVPSQSLASFGSWLEQLIAESTGKEKMGVLPVDTEALGGVSDYGDDRFFVSIRRKTDPDFKILEAKLKNLSKAGLPWIDIIWPSDVALGGEFLAWEIATAIAGVVLKVNPFDEPNVTESKEITSRLLGVIKKGKTLEMPTRYYSVNKHVELGLIFKQIKHGSYLSLLPYLARNPEWAAVFQRIRQKIRCHFRIPVLLGFGPRYLHSIGQFYKGGTASGLFMEFISDDVKDIPVPDTHYTFSQLKRAQALGDFEAIQNKGLPIILIDLGKDVASGLKKFERKLTEYLTAQK